MSNEVQLTGKSSNGTNTLSRHTYKISSPHYSFNFISETHVQFNIYMYIVSLELRVASLGAANS